MELPKNKQDALDLIEQYNDAIKTCLEQDNISALQETYDIRNSLIKLFFKQFDGKMSEADIRYFKELKSRDEKSMTLLEEIKRKVLKDSASQKKSRDGIKCYNRIGSKESKK